MINSDNRYLGTYRKWKRFFRSMLDEGWIVFSYLFIRPFRFNVLRDVNRSFFSSGHTQFSFRKWLNYVEKNITIYFLMCIRSIISIHYILQKLHICCLSSFPKVNQYQQQPYLYCTYLHTLPSSTNQGKGFLLVSFSVLDAFILFKSGWLSLDEIKFPRYKISIF